MKVEEPRLVPRSKSRREVLHLNNDLKVELQDHELGGSTTRSGAFEIIDDRTKKQLIHQHTKKQKQPSCRIQESVSKLPLPPSSVISDDDASIATTEPELICQEISKKIALTINSGKRFFNYDKCQI